MRLETLTRKVRKIVTHQGYTTVRDHLDAWKSELLTGKPPTLYSVGDGDLARFEIGPGLVTMIGGAPGAGKTALIMQLTFEALKRNPTLRALVANVEMSPTVLLDRQLARIADVDLGAIRHRRLAPGERDKINNRFGELEAVADRLGFVGAPFDLSNVAESADCHEADLIVLDYIQRVGPPRDDGDRRRALDATMSYLRRFAESGVAVVVIAALARSRDAKGRSSYGEGLNLASFRESSELEYGADDAFILVPDDESDGPMRRVTLRHLKSRHGETGDIALEFQGAKQRFTSVESKPSGATQRRLEATVGDLWKRTGSNLPESPE